MPTTTSRLAVRSPPSRSPGPRASPLLDSKPFRDNEVDSRDGGAQRFSQLQLNSRGDRNRKAAENGPKSNFRPRSKTVQPTNTQPAQTAPKKAEPPTYQPTPIYPKALFPDVVHKIFGEDLDATVKDFSPREWQELCEFFDKFPFSYLQWEYSSDTQVLMVFRPSPNHQEMVQLRKAHLKQVLKIVNTSPKSVQVVMKPLLDFAVDTTPIYAEEKGRKGHLAEKFPDVVVELTTTSTRDITSLDEIMVSQLDYSPETQPQGDRPIHEGGFTKALNFIDDRATALRSGKKTPLKNLRVINVIAVRETFDTLAKSYTFPGGSKKHKSDTQKYKDALECKMGDVRSDDAMFARLQEDVESKLTVGGCAYSEHLIPGAGPWVCEVNGQSYVWHAATRAYWIHVNVLDDDEVAKFTALVKSRAQIHKYLEAGLGTAILDKYEGVHKDRRDDFLKKVALGYQSQLDVYVQIFTNKFWEKVVERFDHLPTQEDLLERHSAISDIANTFTYDAACDEIRKYWENVSRSAQGIDLTTDLEDMLHAVKASSKLTAQWRIKQSTHEPDVDDKDERTNLPLENIWELSFQRRKRKRGTSDAASDGERRAGPSAGPHAVD
ncbi:uncharacterized protein C8Q71DRAFT_854225 [Rhodofomes roseus]|uniref:Uncharacterized protein n=1 Tax=Rhodofomes roseus TaxID=34475 RepID=A0ABQ8KSX0_9APHY|nr:uncharacterized protein C8Q71DRAFT_854225 [Rhodofomes roseus]KAH9841869.1 hypothetical protein C8Q71DRAFT_854225 [Rhodofomes roseus]